MGVPPPPGVLVSGHSVEAGCSMEVLHIIRIIFSRNIFKKTNKHMTGAALLVHNQPSPYILDCIFFHHILKMKPNWLCLLDTGDNNRRTLVGMVKGWELLLYGFCCLTEVLFKFVFFLFPWDFDYWLLDIAWYRIVSVPEFYYESMNSCIPWGKSFFLTQCHRSDSSIPPKYVTKW